MAAEGVIEGSEHVYPPYMVGATSLLGLFLTRWLAARSAIPPLAQWALRGVYASKLVLLALPGSRPLADVVGVVLAATLPGALFPAPAEEGAAEAAAGRRRGMTRLTGGALLATLACALVRTLARVFARSENPRNLLSLFDSHLSGFV